MKILLTGVIVFSLFTLVSCGKTETNIKDEGPKVRVSTGETGDSGMPSDVTGDRQ